MKISRKQIKELGKRLHYSSTDFEKSYWFYKIRYKKHHSFHEFRFLDYLKANIELIGRSRGTKNKYYLKYQELYKNVVRHIDEDLKLKRVDFPWTGIVDLSHIDFTNCNVSEKDYKEVKLEEKIKSLKVLIKSEKKLPVPMQYNPTTALSNLYRLSELLK